MRLARLRAKRDEASGELRDKYSQHITRVEAGEYPDWRVLTTVRLNELQPVAQSIPGEWQVRTFRTAEGLEVAACLEDANGDWDSLELFKCANGEFNSWFEGSRFFAHLRQTELRVYDTAQWRAWEPETFQPSELFQSQEPRLVRWSRGAIESVSPAEALARFDLIAPAEVAGAVMSASVVRVDETFYDPFHRTALTVQGTRGLAYDAQVLSGRTGLPCTVLIDKKAH